MKTYLPFENDMIPSNNCGWVSLKDHKAELATKDARIKELEAAIKSVSDEVNKEISETKQFLADLRKERKKGSGK